LAGVYGQNIGNGATRKGITIETLSHAQVIATYDGQVVFAGAFRGYGQLLIIEHGGGYHSLLAGLARIDSDIGQTVVAGEPVGVMGRLAGARPVLYLELRRNGQPINPLPWLAASKNRVSG
jgi:septal ring factor EnvC (AmiA/AmiB activator)